MSHFHQTPEELCYIIYTYLNYEDTVKLSKAFKLYIDYEELCRLKLPDPTRYLQIAKTYKDKQINWNKLYEDLYSKFPNKTQNVDILLDDGINNSSDNIYYGTLININFPEIFKYVDVFPDDPHRNRYIFDAIDKLKSLNNKGNLYTYQLLHTPITTESNNVDLNKLSNELVHDLTSILRSCWSVHPIFYLIIVHKYKIFTGTPYVTSAIDSIIGYLMNTQPNYQLDYFILVVCGSILDYIKKNHMSI